MGAIDYNRYTAVLIILVVFVIIYFTVRAIAYFGQENLETKRYPPWLSPCPDYWSYVGGTVCKKPPATELNQGLAKCNATVRSADYSYDFNNNTIYDTTSGAATVDFAGMSLKQKCAWGKACEVYWQGITDHPCTDDNFKKYETM